MRTFVSKTRPATGLKQYMQDAAALGWALERIIMKKMMAQEAIVNLPSFSPQPRTGCLE